MNVGLVIERFDPRRGGAEQWTWQFAQRLIERGHQVHVTARSFTAPEHRLAVCEEPIDAPQSRIEFAAAAERRLRRLGLDVVHDMGVGWYCDVFQPHGGSRRAAFEQNLLLLPRWLRPLKRRAAHALPRYREFEELVARQYADDGRLLVALSQMVARHFRLLHGVGSRRIRVIYNGVDVSRFTPERRETEREAVRAHLGVSDDEVLLLIVAHNYRLKGVPALIEATGRLVREGWPVRLAIAGGRHPERYARLARRRGASAATLWLGPVDDAAPFYAAADVYVQPTLYDPCSLVVLEALASGLPVITSRFNGAGELLTPGSEGELLDDPQDAAELVERLRPLFNATRRERMGQAARQLALEHSLERNCDEMLALYEEVAARRKAA